MNTKVSDKNRSSVMAKVIHWIARIWSVLVLLFLAMMFIGNFLSEGDDMVWKTEEILAAFLFPIGTSVGMIIAWKKEFIGGLITTVCMIIFFILMVFPDGKLGAEVITFSLIGMPGVLFMISGLLVKKLGNLKQD